ncbi:MAG: sulfur carrier protein ThiS adenylyltransferase ThiF [Peptostreptococcaceae bacterium]|nr:sulfur carrier protein ThiS adenylyltransferase ThiF [Peptostreptococcaceae bacterium]
MVKIKIKINEIDKIVDKNTEISEVLEKLHENIDLVILNGHVIKENKVLKENDNLILIKKDKKYTKKELKTFLYARNTKEVNDKFKNSKVAIAGLGGIGSNVALSLARVGITKMLLVDFDIVEPSNINRQVYSIFDIGRKKTQALKMHIESINPYIELDIIDRKIEREDVEEIFKDYEIVVEAFDDPRYKSILVEELLILKKQVVACSGMAGYFDSNLIKTKKVNDNLYICGDLVNEAKEFSGLMSPRVLITAGHMSNMICNLIINKRR